MVIVRVIGGLGNQMFQYVYAYALSKKGYDVKLDLSSFDNYDLHGGYQLNHYNLKLESATKNDLSIFSKLSKKQKIFSFFNPKLPKNVKEHGLNFKTRLLEVKDNSYIKGYFQSEKYFVGIKSEILETFSLSNYSKYTLEMEKQINESKNSISLHIRRGDYVSNKQANEVHGTCDLNYYYKAISYLKDKFNFEQIFVFSDDIKWCENNLKIDGIKLIFVKSIENKLLPHEDIFLMSQCKHNIIANSSFSWWGAWLNNYPEKIVIAPKRWYVKKEKQKQVENSLIPDSWIKI